MNVLVPAWFVLLVSGLFGLIFGSFLNVCIHRMPRDEPMTGRSRCPSCGETVSWYDNVPLLSFVLLGGMCRHCDQRISARYPLVELLTALIFVGTAWWWLIGSKPDPLNFILCTIFFTVSLGMTLVDLEFSIIPNEMNYFLLLLGLLISGIPRYPFVSQSRWVFEPWLMAESLGGLALGGGIFLVLALVSPYFYGQSALGMGDVKLIAAYGLWLGPRLILFTIIFGALVGAVIGSLMMFFQGKTLRTRIPFGPYLCLAGVISLIWGHEIVDWYLTMTAPAL